MNIARFSALMFLVTAASASAQHSDVLLRSDGSKVLIGGAFDLSMEEGPSTFDLETHVFEGVLIDPAVPTPPFGFDFERTEPGFFSAPGLPVGDDLPANADVALSLSTFSLGAGSDTAYYWDGVGEVDFRPLSAAQPGVNFTFAPMAPSPFATTDGAGSMDDHPLFGLTGGAADGVYVISPVVSVEGLADSDPFLMVWLASSVLIDEDTAEQLEEALEAFEGGGPDPMVGGVNFAFFEEAVEFVESIPEPSSVLLALLASAAVGALSRR